MDLNNALDVPKQVRGCQEMWYFSLVLIGFNQLRWHGVGEKCFQVGGKGWETIGILEAFKAV